MVLVPPRVSYATLLSLTRQTALFQLFHKIVSLNAFETVFEMDDGKVRTKCSEVFKHASTGAIPRTQVAFFCDFWWKVESLAEFFKEMLPVWYTGHLLLTLTDEGPIQSARHLLHNLDSIYNLVFYQGIYKVKRTSLWFNLKKQNMVVITELCRHVAGGGGGGGAAGALAPSLSPHKPQRSTFLVDQCFKRKCINNTFQILFTDRVVNLKILYCEVVTLSIKLVLALRVKVWKGSGMPTRHLPLRRLLLYSNGGFVVQMCRSANVFLPLYFNWEITVFTVPSGCLWFLIFALSEMDLWSLAEGL